jgi:hypothetical protein
VSESGVPARWGSAWPKAELAERRLANSVLAKMAVAKTGTANA